jgi:hypothetical protein
VSLWQKTVDEVEAEHKTLLDKIKKNSKIKDPDTMAWRSLMAKERDRIRRTKTRIEAQ